MKKMCDNMRWHKEKRHPAACDINANREANGNVQAAGCRLSLRLFAAFAPTLFATLLATAADFYWTGNDENDNNWSTVGNWGNPCESAADGAFTFTKADSTIIYLKAATAKPGSSDNAYFEQTATITLTTSENINYTHFNADVTFTCASSQYINFTRDVSGAGKKITLAGNVYVRAASRAIEIKTDLEANGTHSLNDSKGITVSGALTGNGSLTCNNAVNFTGGTSGFTGTLTFATDSALATTSMTVASGATVLIPYDDVSADIAEKWTINTGGSVKFRLAGTTTATVEANKDVKFPFSNAATVLVYTDSHKAGDPLFTCSHGSTSDWTASTIKVYSPNTDAASLFYGEPTIVPVDGKVVIKAAYASNAGVWCGDSGADFGAWASWGLKAAGTNDRLRNYRLIVESDASAKVDSADIPSILFLDNMELTGTAQLKPHGTCVWEGPGKVTMSGTGNLRLVNSGSFTMYNDLDITANKTFSVEVANYNANLFGKVSLSSGKTLTLSDSSSKPGAVIFHGDTSGIVGTINASWANCEASYLQFAGAATNLVNATITLGATGNSQPLCATSGTYTFGSLSGNVTGGDKDVTIVTGSKDSAGKTITYNAEEAAWNWVKEGYYELTLNGSYSNLGRVTVRGDGGLGTVSELETENYTLGLATQYSESTFSKATSGIESVTVAEASFNIENTWIADNVPGTIVKAEDIATEKGANGITYFESYAMGLTPSSKDSTPKMSAPTANSDGTITPTVNVIPPEGVTLTVTAKSYSDAACTTEVMDDNDISGSIVVVGGATPPTTNNLKIYPAKMDGTVKYYKLDIAISATTSSAE